MEITNFEGSKLREGYKNSIKVKSSQQKIKSFSSEYYIFTQNKIYIYKKTKQ